MRQRVKGTLPGLYLHGNRTLMRQRVKGTLPGLFRSSLLSLNSMILKIETNKIKKKKTLFYKTRQYYIYIFDKIIFFWSIGQDKSKIQTQIIWVTYKFGRRKEMFLFNDALNTFYLRIYGVGHMVKDHSDRERRNPLPPHRLLFPISSKGSFICIIRQTG